MIILDSIVDAARHLPPDNGGAFLLGVADYTYRCLEAGMTEGIDAPFGDDPILEAFFIGMKVSIDKSIGKQIAGGKGGASKHSDSEPEANYKQNGSKRKAKLKQSESEPETDTEQTPSEGKEEGKGKVVGSNEPTSSGDSVYEAVIGRLNEKTGKSFKATSAQTRSMINGRLAEGYTLEDFFHVIDTMCARWGSPRPGEKDMRPYLRPQTLFRPGNFESYVNEKGGGSGVDLGRYSKPEGEAF